MGFIHFGHRQNAVCKFHSLRRIKIGVHSSDNALMENIRGPDKKSLFCWRIKCRTELCFSIICAPRYGNMQLKRLINFQVSEGECAVNRNLIGMLLKF